MPTLFFDTRKKSLAQNLVRKKEMTPGNSERIAILRTLMIGGIVLLHVPPYVPIAEIGNGYFDFIKAFFQNAVFRCTVPVLTVISGYLLFGADLDRTPKKLFLKKLKTLGVPFLIFNTSIAIAVYSIQSRVNLPITYQLFPLNLAVVLDAGFGLTRAPINYPLNFIRDLVVLIFMAPAMGILIRRLPVFGLGIVILIFGFDLDGYVLLRWDMAVHFYVGGIAALRKWDLHRMDKYAIPFLLIFVFLCSVVVIFKIANTTFLRLASPFLIWPAASILNGTRLGVSLASFSKYSYFVFLAHALVLVSSWMLYKNIASGLPYPLYWGLSPVFTITVLIGLYHLGISIAPTAFKWMTGQEATR